MVKAEKFGHLHLVYHYSNFKEKISFKMQGGLIFFSKLDWGSDDDNELLCDIIDGLKALSLISSRDHCQRSSPSQVSDTLQAGFEPAQNLSPGFV